MTDKTCTAIFILIVLAAFTAMFYAGKWVFNDIKHDSKKNIERKHNKQIASLPEGSKVIETNNKWITFEHKGNCYFGKGLYKINPYFVLINCREDQE